MYVIRPASYNLWASVMVCDTEYPSLREASCCRVDVVNGGAGVRFAGLVSTCPTENDDTAQSERKAPASSFVSKRCAISAFTTEPSPVVNSADTLYDERLVKDCISRSRSTISRTATDCTRPADNPLFILRHKSGDIS